MNRLSSTAAKWLGPAGMQHLLSSDIETCLRKIDLD